MTSEGALVMEWIVSPQRDRADGYRITFAAYQNQEQALFTREFRTEAEVRKFIVEDIRCTEMAVFEALKGLSQSARAKIDHIQLSDEVLSKLRGEKNGHFQTETGDTP